MSFFWLKNIKNRPRAFLQINSRKEYFNFCIQLLKAVKKIKKVRGKKILSTFLLIFTISALGIFILGAKEAKAAWWLLGYDPIDIAFNALAWIIARIGAIIQALASIFFWVAALFLQMVFSIEEFTKSPVVQVGWKLTRGLVNLFFVLILMAIAFATILQIDAYGLKKVLPKLIIAALLINFSLVIAGAIIDFSQVLTHFLFDNAIGELGLSAQLAKILGLQHTYELNPEANVGEKMAEGIGGIIMLIFNIFAGTFLILAAALILALGAFLLIVRLIALWILLILAPLAWFFWILPATKNLWESWWRSFLKWTFFAPVFAFFVYLALKASEGGGMSNIISQNMEQIVEAEGWKKIFMTTLLSTPKLLLQYIAILGLLIGGLIAGQKMSIYGAQGTMKIAKWAGGGAAGATSRWLAQRPVPFSKTMGNLITKAAGGREGRFAQRLRTLGATIAETRGRGVFSPGAWKRTWPEITKERERRAYGVRTAELRDQLTSIFSLGREKSDYGERAKRQQRIEERKKVVTISAEELVGNIKRAFGAGQIDIGAANMQALAEQGDLNDLMKAYGYKFSAQGLSKFTEEKLKPLMGEQDAYRLMFDLNRANERVGQWPGRVFKGEYDEKTGRTTYKDVIKETVKAGKTEKEGTKIALTEAYKAWSRMDPQEKARFTHRLGVISESEKGENAGVEGHEMWIRGLSSETPNAVRISDEVKATLMLRHAKETQTLNKSLYDELSKIFAKKSDDEIRALQDMLQPVAEGVTITSWRRPPTPEKPGGFGLGMYP